MQTFKEWLRSSLDERHWTGSDLERASGVSNSIIWRWLSDRPRRPTPANLQKIAPHLGASYEDLMRMCGYLPGEPPLVVADPRLAALTASIVSGWHSMDETARDVAERGTRALFMVPSTSRLSNRHNTGAPTPGSGGRRHLNGHPRSGEESADHGGLPTVFGQVRDILARISATNILTPMFRPVWWATLPSVAEAAR